MDLDQKAFEANTELLFPRTSFQKLVRELLQKLGAFRMEAQALAALQEAGEVFLSGLFEDANLFCLHGKRVTIMQKDLQLSQRVRNVQKDVTSSEWQAAETQPGATPEPSALGATQTQTQGDEPLPITG